MPADVLSRSRSLAGKLAAILIFAALAVPAEAYLHKVGNITYRGTGTSPGPVQNTGFFSSFTEAARFACLHSMDPTIVGVDAGYAANREAMIKADPFDAANSHTDQFTVLCRLPDGSGVFANGGVTYTYTCTAPWNGLSNPRPECKAQCVPGATEYLASGLPNPNPTSNLGESCKDVNGFSSFGRIAPDGVASTKVSACDGRSNPCNPATGMKTQAEPVYQGAAGAHPLRYALQYRSKRTDDPFDEWRGLHGVGWISPFERRVKFYDPASNPGAGSWGVKRPDGSEFEFKTPSSGNVFVADADVIDRLERLVDGGGATTGWKYSAASGDEVETYDANGVLLEVANRAGARITLTYSSGTTNDTSVSRYPSTAPACSVVHPPISNGGILGPGKLLCATDPDGRQINFQYDLPTGTWIAKLLDPALGEYAFEYDGVSGGCPVPGGTQPQCSAKNLTKLTFPGGASRIWHYNEAANINGGAACPAFPNGLLNQLTGITDENASRFSDYTYDCEGRATSTQHAGGTQKASFAWNIDGSTTVADYVGNPASPTVTPRKYSFQTTLGVPATAGIVDPATGNPSPCALCGNAASSTFDANRNVASRTDWNGNRTNYGYDLARNLETSRIEGLTSAGAPTPQTRTISTEWHAGFRLPIRMAEPLRITSFVYNGDGGVTCGFKPDGVTPVPGVVCSKTIQATTDPSGAAGFSATPTGAPRTWSYTYNAHGLVLTANGPRTDLADVTTYAYFSSAASCPTASGGHTTGCRGQVHTITNAPGQVTTFTGYNAHGQPMSFADANGLTTALGYDPRLRLASRTAGAEATNYDYDFAGQLIKVTLPDSSFLEFGYDAAHRLTEVKDNADNRIAYTLDLMGNRTLERVLDPASSELQRRRRVYSALNRLEQELGGQTPPQVTVYEHDPQGNVFKVTDPRGHVTTNAYDALNRLVRVTAADTGEVNYGLDGLDQVVSVSDPRALVTTYTLDGLGNLSGQVSPDTGTTSNSFDTAGNVLGSTDAKGQVSSYQYDALNRLTRAEHAGGHVIVYAYDEGTNGIGRLTSISDDSGSTAYAYDLHGRVTSESRVIGGTAYTTEYGYDAAGRMNQVIYPSGRQVTHGFDALGRVLSVTTAKDGSSQSVVTAVTYQPFGTVKAFNFGNGQSYARAFDEDGRIKSYTQGSLTRALGFDLASNIESIGAPGVPENIYTYDPVNRLLTYARPGDAREYSYDAVGNRRSVTAGGTNYPYSYPATSNRLAQTAGPVARSFAYDANGSVTGDGTNSFGYDSRGRMVLATTPAGATSYQVNALGQRVAKADAAGETHFHYDTQGRLIAESSTGGVIHTEYIYLGDMPVAVIK